MTLFTRRKKQSDALKVRLVDRPLCALRVDEFRADKELVHLAAVVMADPNFQIMVQVLRNDHPGFDVLPSGADSIQRIVKEAQGEGYTMALATLESLGIQANIPERLVSTFESEPSESQTG